jgi:hypothetical protein
VNLTLLSSIRYLTIQKYLEQLENSLESHVVHFHSTGIKCCSESCLILGYLPEPLSVPHTTGATVSTTYYLAGSDTGVRRNSYHEKNSENKI